jgi:hypothetical protein
MVWIAATLWAVTALGLVALAARYLFGPAPTTHHAAVLRQGGGTIGEPQRLLFVTLNRILGCCQLAIAVGAFTLAWLGLSEDRLDAKLAFIAIVLLVGVPSGLAMQRLERLTGVRNPWRATIALVSLSLLGFAASLA